MFYFSNLFLFNLLLYFYIFIFFLFYFFLFLQSLIESFTLFILLLSQPFTFLILFFYLLRSGPAAQGESRLSERSACCGSDASLSRSGSVWPAQTAGHLQPCVSPRLSPLWPHDPDNEAHPSGRIKTYLLSTRPIIELYEKHGKVRSVDASGSVEEVRKNRVVTVQH